MHQTELAERERVAVVRRSPQLYKFSGSLRTSPGHPVGTAFAVFKLERKLLEVFPRYTHLLISAGRRHNGAHRLWVSVYAPSDTA